MFRAYFDMKNVPFSRKVPPEMLYESAAMAEALGCMKYCPGKALWRCDGRCGKSTLVRRLVIDSPGTNI